LPVNQNPTLAVTGVLLGSVVIVDGYGNPAYGAGKHSNDPDDERCDDYIPDLPQVLLAPRLRRFRRLRHRRGGRYFSNAHLVPPD
jgi:hypothetical protein